MTAAAASPKSTSMLRSGWLLLLALLAVALTVSSAVHAREALGSAAIACGGEAHVDGDADQVPADADQGLPHHHANCHGHAVALETQASSPGLAPQPAERAQPLRGPDLASFLVDPALRPPRA